VTNIVLNNLSLSDGYVLAVRKLLLWHQMTRLT